MVIVIKNKTSPTYFSWASMKARCLNFNDAAYGTHGGRGIKVCDEWLLFEGFLRDMGEKPPNHILERIDKDGNFEKSNCRYVPSKRKRNDDNGK
jgi:hypothetical protein